MKLKNLALVALILSLTACGLKRVDNQPQPQPSKPGITWGQGAVGPVTVQKVGYWCDVRGPSLLTFGAFGETEAKATAAAQANCHKVYKDDPCGVVSCKHE
jgi:hypothetical protein